MNNTKWRKVFIILVDQRINGCTWHFLNDAGGYRWPLPILSDIRRDGIADGRWCPIYFRDIEKVSVPLMYEMSRGRGLEPWRKENNMAELKSAFAALGQLDIDEGPESLTVYGHRLPNPKLKIPAADRP